MPPDIAFPQIVVLERTGDWALALRQSWERRAARAKVAAPVGKSTSPLLPAALSVRETRSADECWSAVSAARDGVLLVHWGAATPDAAARLLARCALLRPAWRTLVAATAAMRSLEPSLRELGVVGIVYSLCEVERVLAAIERRATA